MQKSTRSRQKCKSIKLFIAGKTYEYHPNQDLKIFFFFLAMWHLWLPSCVLHRGSHHHITGIRNIQSQHLNEDINNFGSGLAVWRMSRNQFEPVCSSFPKNSSKIAQPPKQVHRSTRCIFFQRSFLLEVSYKQLKGSWLSVKLPCKFLLK